MDPLFAWPAAHSVLRRDHGLLITLEHAEFDETLRGRYSKVIPHWSVAKIKRAGADGVKDGSIFSDYHKQSGVKIAIKNSIKRYIHYIFFLSYFG